MDSALWKRRFAMKAKIIVTILVAAALLCSCEFDSDVDTSGILPAEPTALTNEDQYRALLDLAVGSTYQAEGLKALTINYVEEEYFTVNKSEQVYFLYGGTTMATYPILFDTFGYPTVSNAGYKNLTLTLNKDASKLMLDAEGSTYTYGRT